MIRRPGQPESRRAAGFPGSFFLCLLFILPCLGTARRCLGEPRILEYQILQENDSREGSQVFYISGLEKSCEGLSAELESDGTVFGLDENSFRDRGLLGKFPLQERKTDLLSGPNEGENSWQRVFPAEEYPAGIPVYTMLLVDNDDGISPENREKLKTILQAVIEHHGPEERLAFYTFHEGELERINTFSTFYEFLYISARELTFEDNDKALISWLPTCLGELNTEDEPRFFRLLLVCDGSRQEESTMQELMAYLEENPLPVYCLEQQGEEASGFSDLCERTGGRYFPLEGTEPEDVADALASDTLLRVLELMVPKACQSGEMVNERLSGIQDGMGFLLEKRLRLPRSASYTVPTPSPSPVPSPSPTPSPLPTSTPVSEVGSGHSELGSEHSGEKGGGLFDQLKRWAPLLMGAGLFLLLVSAVLLYRKKRKAKDAAAEKNRAAAPGETQRSMAVLKDLQYPEHRYDLPERNSLVIGKDLMYCDYAITEDPTISRRHMKVLFEGGNLFVEDLGSRNGTWVNRHRVTDKTPLNNGDTLRMGDSEFLVETGEENREWE